MTYVKMRIEKHIQIPLPDKMWRKMTHTFFYIINLINQDMGNYFVILKILMYDEDITIAYRQNAFYDYWLHEMLLGILKTCDLKSVCILFDE